jgi:pimeloyl-ACP methyl ester carboxylesterase
VETAGKLSRLIEQIRRDFGNPDLKVDLIAHSMGGLMARYYLRYGEQDVLDGNEFTVNMHGRSRLRRVILLGAPNLGSVEAIKSFIAGRDVGFTRIPTEVLVTLPSVYQLFPHAINDWLVTVAGVPLERDQFDVDIWRRFHWSVFDPEVRRRIRSAYADPGQGEARLQLLERYFEKSLERARRFSWSLTVPVDAPLPLIVFGGDCEMTPARLVVEEVEGDSVLRLWPDEIAHPLPNLDYADLMLEPGDGLVTKASLLGRPVLDPSVPRHKYSFFPLDYPFFLCEQHDTLASNVSFLDNLLHALLNRDRDL